MKPKPLWQVSVSTSSEADEAVAHLLEQAFQQLPSIYTDMETGDVTVSVHLQKLDATPRSVQARLKKALAPLTGSGLISGPCQIRIQKLPAENWAESWKRHFKPIQIGRALLIKPSWSKRNPLKGQALVVLDPGLSFGTGQHATTSFCLSRLVVDRRKGERQSFLDIGSGSGILSISAAKLGYTPVDAFDFDPEAVRISRQNARDNQVAVKPQHKDLTLLPVRPTRRYDVICANLIYDLLISQSKKICLRLKPSGHLILAGILETQFPQVQKAYEALGFRLTSSREEKEWRSGEFTRLK